MLTSKTFNSLTLQVIFIFFCGFLVESKHVKSGALTGIIQSVWRGMQFCELQGDIEQQGGALILGPG